jgi:hypothetical protein
MRPNLRLIAAIAAAAGLLAVVWLAAPPPAHAGTWPESSDGSWRGHGWFQTNGFALPAQEMPVRLAFVGSPPPGLSMEDVEHIARAASAAWSQVPCSVARVEYAGHRDTIDDLGPGEIPFQFDDPAAIQQCFPEGVIAWTSLSCPGDFPDRSVFFNSADFDWTIDPRPFQPAVTDPDEDRVNRLAVDLPSVLVHELGHVLGLSHSQDTLATMYASYRPDGGQSSLAVDDKLGICHLYESAHPRDECSSGRDCAPRESCERAGDIRLCHELRGEVGDACAPDRLVCTERCVHPEADQRYGYCTKQCQPGAAGAASCPPDFRCVEGLLQPDQHHCERTNVPDDPTCTLVTDARPGGWPGWLWILFAFGAFRALSYPGSGTRKSCSR